MLKKRILSFLGAAALTAVLTFAVVSLSPANGFTSGSMQEGLSYEVCGVSPDAIVASLDGNGASADLITYWIGYNASYLNSYMQYYGGGALDWDYVMADGTTMPDYIMQDVLTTVKQELLVENLAEKYGVTLTDAQRAAMDADVQGFVEQYGSEEAFDEELAKLGLRRETYERITSANYLFQNLYQLYLTEGSALYVSAEDLAAYAAAQGYITADHILLTTVDTATGEALSDEAIAEKKALAEELADEYSEDPGRASNPTGYTFTTGSMVKEFEDAAYALDEGAVSDIVESSFGYHILLRLPLDKTAAAENVREAYFTNLIDTQLEKAVIATSEQFSALDAKALYEAIAAAQ